MKTLLSLVLILLAMICLGQNYNRSTKERIKSDSIMKIEIRNDSIAYMKLKKNIPLFNGYVSSGGYNGYTGSTYTFKPGKAIKAKLTLSSTGMVTINIDEFKVTDTIWIQSGKRRVGIPAYKFLDYFKEDNSTLFLPSNSWGNTLNKSTLEYHITPTTK